MIVRVDRLIQITMSVLSATLTANIVTMRVGNFEEYALVFSDSGNSVNTIYFAYGSRVITAQTV